MLPDEDRQEEKLVLLETGCITVKSNRLLQQEGQKCIRKDLPQSPVTSVVHGKEELDFWDQTMPCCKKQW